MKYFKQTFGCCDSFGGDCTGKPDREGGDGAFADQVFTDILNDTVAVLNPQAEPKILATAHLDEIGLVITCADEHGYLYAIDRGGVIPQTYPGHKVQIHTEHGMVKGVVNGSRALCRKEKMEVTDLVIDIGADSKEEALSL